MTDRLDRPLFDDEDLPAWLKTAGITYGGKRATGMLTAVGALPWNKRLPPEIGSQLRSTSWQAVPWVVEVGRKGRSAPSQGYVPWTGGDPASKPAAASRMGDEASVSDLWQNINLNAFGQRIAPETMTPDAFEIDASESENFADFLSAEDAGEIVEAADPLSDFGLRPISGETGFGEGDLPLDADPFAALSTSEMFAITEADLASGDLTSAASDLSLTPEDDPFAAVIQPIPEQGGEGSLDDLEALFGEGAAAIALPQDAISSFDEPLAWDVSGADSPPDAHDPFTLPIDSASGLDPLPVDDDLLDLFGDRPAESPPAAPGRITSTTTIPDYGLADIFKPGETGELPSRLDDADPFADPAPSALPMTDDLPDFFKGDSASDNGGKEDIPPWITETPVSLAPPGLPAAPPQSWITNTNKLPEQPNITAEFPEPDWMHGEETDLVSGYIAPEQFLAADSAPQPGDVPMPTESQIHELANAPDLLEGLDMDILGIGEIAADDSDADMPDIEALTGITDADLPEWMRDVPGVPAELMGAAETSAPAADAADLDFDQLDWLATVDMESVGQAPSPSMAPPAAADEDDPLAALFSSDDEPPDIPRPMPSMPRASGLPELDTSGVDIDALLNLPASGALNDILAIPETALPQIDFDAEFSFADSPNMPPSETLNASMLDDIAQASEDFSLTLEAAPPTVNLPKHPTAALPKLAIPLPPETPPAASERLIEAAPSIPDWVVDARAADLPVVLRIGDQQIKLKDSPAADLPNEAKLLRERVKLYREKPAPEAPAPSGALSGISDAILPAATFGGVVPNATNIGKLTFTDLQTKRIQALQTLLNAQDDVLMNRIDTETVMGASPIARTRAAPKLDRILVTLLLAAAVVLPFFVRGLTIAPMPTFAALSAAQQADFAEVTETIDVLQGGQAVLVAFEYAPTAAGELDELARLIVADIVRKGARPIFVSTTPAGVLRARQIAGQMSGLNASLVLAYLPGGALGVQSLASAVNAPGFWRNYLFASDVNGQPSGVTDSEISSLRNTPVFVLAETQEDVRTWVEQYRLAGAANGAFRVAFITSAASAAVTRSYASAPNGVGRILGPLSGLRDALIYRELRNLSAEMGGEANVQRAAQRWQSLSLASLVTALIVFIGIIIGALNAGRRRR
ncbi:MAG TPA: hypothetical protein PLD47_05750 [Aggregatilineales bacterium]|nr:hypothetical protein [Anaerolineales bacterium]HRE47211.1 hypothetical protein [Aggregatilineales bacterium]